MTDDPALKELFTTHANALALYARQWCTDFAEAEDIVQDAFVQYWQHRAAASDPAAYLYTAVRSRALDKRRSDSRRLRREENVARPESADWFSVEPEKREFAEIVQASLRQLPPDQMEVVVLKLWGELTFAQIGQILAIPLNTAASRYRYGIEALRKMMNHEVTP